MAIVLLRIFTVKKKPKEKAPCKCLSIIMLDFYIEAKKVLFSKSFGRMQMLTKKDKNGESYGW